MDTSKNDTFKPMLDNHDYKGKPNDFEKNLKAISNQAEKKIEGVASRFSSAVPGYLQRGQGYVSEHPMKGVAIAAAVGLVVGSLVTLAVKRK